MAEGLGVEDLSAFWDLILSLCMAVDEIELLG